MPTLRAREVIRALIRLGFEVTDQEGSHVKLKRPNGMAVTVPDHGSRDLGRGMVQAIIRDGALTREQFLDALRDA